MLTMGEEIMGLVRDQSVNDSGGEIKVKISSNPIQSTPRLCIT